MGQLCRHLARGLCGVMLLACLSTGVLWVASYQFKIIVRLPVSPGSTRFEFFSYRGLLACSSIVDFPAQQPYEALMLPNDSGRAARWDYLFWRDSYAGFSGEDGRIWVAGADGEMVVRPWLNLMFPYWLLLVLAAAAPVRDACLLLRARHRACHGQCATCGYETSGSDTCPACAARQQVVGLSPRTHFA